MGVLQGQPSVGQSISVVEQVQSTPRRLGVMETLGAFFIYLAWVKEIFIGTEFNCSSLGLVQLKLQFFHCDLCMFSLVPTSLRAKSSVPLECWIF